MPRAEGLGLALQELKRQHNLRGRLSFNPDSLYPLSVILFSYYCLTQILFFSIKYYLIYWYSRIERSSTGGLNH